MPCWLLYERLAAHIRSRVRKNLGTHGFLFQKAGRKSERSSDRPGSGLMNSSSYFDGLYHISTFQERRIYHPASLDGDPGIAVGKHREQAWSAIY
jgi:hypothetical protein